MRFFALMFFMLMPYYAFSQHSTAALISQLKAATDSSKIRLYNEISNSYASVEPDSAVYYANYGLKLAEKTNNKRGQALLLLQLANINQLHNNRDLARWFINEALSVSTSINDKDGIALAYDHLGLLDAKNENINVALGDLNKSMKLFSAGHDLEGVAETYKGLGEVYESKKDTDRALKYYLRALAQYKLRPIMPDSYFVLLNNIGNLYIKKGDTKLALQYFELGVKNSNSPGLADTQINLLSQEGKAYEQSGQKTRALGYYKLILEKAKKNNLPEDQAKALMNIADILKKENATKSMDDLQKALRIADNIHHPELAVNIYKAMAGVYQQGKNYKEAMMALEEHNRLLDSLLNVDENEEVAVVDSSYKLETSREQIDNLEHANKQTKMELNAGLVITISILVILLILVFYFIRVRKLNKQLKESNQVKDTLFSVIGHDLKGPAGSAAQAFSMLETETFTPEELKSVISELRKQTNASFELLNSLFEWGNAQLRGVKVNRSAFNPKQLITKNLNVLHNQATKKAIIIEDRTPDDMLVFADQDHFDFVIRNLVSNAIKFTNPTGTIEINAGNKPGSDFLIFSIKDTGIGINEEKQKDFLKTNLAVSFGTSGEKGSGLGLLLTKEFIRASQGKIWLESSEGVGTTFYFSLPNKLLK